MHRLKMYTKNRMIKYIYVVVPLLCLISFTACSLQSDAPSQEDPSSSSAAQMTFVTLPSPPVYKTTRDPATIQTVLNLIESAPKTLKESAAENGWQIMIQVQNLSGQKEYLISENQLVIDGTAYSISADLITPLNEIYEQLSSTELEWKK